MYQTKTDTSAIGWTPTGQPGVSMKMLQQGDCACAGMMRMEAGSFVGAHKHTSADQSVFVVEGDLIDGDVTYGPGTYLVAKAGTPHGPHTTKGGCVLLSWYSGPPDFVAVG